jgi:hypothetical protein
MDFVKWFVDLFDLYVWKCEHKCRVVSSLPGKLITSLLYINKRILQQLGNKTDATSRTSTFRWDVPTVKNLLARTL